MLIIMDLLNIENLKIYYFTRRGIVRAVDGVNLRVSKREVLGIVGESGCGKSTLAYGILRIIPEPGRVVDGHIYFNGVDLIDLSDEELNKYRWRHISMVFQGAMNALDPVFTVKDQIIEAITTHDKSIGKKDAEERVYKLMELVGLNPDVANKYPFELSGGMRQRVVIAMALSLNPELVIADEPTTALDVTTQAQILELMKNLKNTLDMSIIIISHDITVVNEISDKIAVMYAGKIVEYGDIDRVLHHPIHPYTKGLIMCVPDIAESGVKTLLSIPGEPPDLINIPNGCRFAPRCPYAREECFSKPPKAYDIDGVYVECHYADKLADMKPEEFWAVLNE